MADSPNFTSPLSDTVASPDVTDHVTPLGAKSVVCTTALNCTIPFALALAVLGDTVTEVTVGVPLTNRALLAKGDTENVFQT